jgi:hypothetical protein
MDGREGTQRTPPRGRRAGLLAALVLATCLGVGAALAGPADAFKHGDDWRHLDLALTYLGQITSQRPVVVLFGGSAARECTISDGSWRRQIVNLGGPRVRAFNLGASSQSYRQNIAMVQRLPDVPTLIVIGVNVGRYTSRPPEASASRADTSKSVTLEQVDDYAQHRFRYPSKLSRAQKGALLTKWLRERYPIFRERFGYNAGQLEELVTACQDRGFKVVLLNLPLNLQVIGHRMDTPRTRYRRDCVALATDYGVPWVNFVAELDLVSRDFADNWHLVEPGRVKWQRRVSRTVVAWLKEYEIGQPTPEPSPEPPPEPTPEPSAPTVAPGAP